MRRASRVIANPTYYVQSSRVARHTVSFESTLTCQKISFSANCSARRRVVRVRYDDFAESCTLNRVGCGGVILIVSDKVARCIRQIEGLRAKLQLNALRQSEILEDRKIKMPERRAIQAVTRRVSDCAERRNDKSGRVKPLTDAGIGQVAGQRPGLDALVRRRFR